VFFRSRWSREQGPQRELERRLGHQFKDGRLLEVALTHRSYAMEQELGVDYERLEFLGDAVLDLIWAEWLYRARPDSDEGELSKLKSAIVSEPSLARIGEELGLGDLMRLGVGEERAGGRHRPSLLADAFEAVVGAIYVDGGIEAARPFLEGLVEDALEHVQSWSRPDAKSPLQERLQGQGRPLPRYVVASSEGPAHERSFTVECHVGGRVLGLGTGRTKKQAEQSAARAALAALEEASD